MTERMRAYIDPFVASDTGQRPDVTVSISCDPRAVDISRQLLNTRPPSACRTAHPGNRYLVWIVDDHEVLLPEWTDDHVVDTAPGTITITGADFNVAATIGTRVIRQLVMRGIENRGGASLHAGCVVVGADGVLVGGKAGSGKTTMLTALLERHAAPVSGDRTMVIADSSGWRAVAVPLAWRFTPEGLSGSRLLGQAWPGMTPARGRVLVEGKAELTPDEVGQVFGRAPVSDAPVHRIVVVERSPEPPPDVVDGWYLRRHMDFGRGDTLGEDWLNLFPHNGNHARPSENLWWTRLGSSVPVMALTWTDPQQLPHLALSIHKWINS
ncbi:hypothetical protein [Nocardia australiensis]|uniref:hypothetical protein n=1 Tax=Nocardia australiensis TaxID=2887191 RepID=UPI001D13F8B1|nr:hypothetical protein [Nocardia australiensis]